MLKLNPFFLMSILAFGLFSCSSTEPNQINNEIVKAKKIPLEDFFKNPEKSSYQISPNGNYYSYMAPYKNRMNIFVQKIGDTSAVQLTHETDRDISGYFWPNDEQIMFLKDAGGDENFHLFGVNIDGTNPISFTDFEGVRAQIIDDLPDQKDFVIIGLNKRNKQVFDPYRLNLKSGEMSMLAENPGNIQGWMFDHDGKLRIATAIVDGVNQSILYRDSEEEEFKTIVTTNFKEGFSPQFFTFDNKNIIGVSNLGRDKSVVVEFDPLTGTEIKELFGNNDYDISGVGYSRKRKVITAAYYNSWKSERHFFDSDSKLTYENIKNHLPGYEIGITGINDDENIFIVRTYSDKSLGAYFIYNSAEDKMDKIVEVSPWIDENEMSSQLPIKYNSRDGLTINGYLTLPKGYNMKNAKNLPVVVNPHGGPWTRDGWGFNPEIQFLANRGYAVLQMNYRGSTGYGRKFWEASFKKWGREMQDDITDGTQWLIDQGIADKNKIAIYGGSYGGYATLMGLVKEPDLYAAGVDYVGVSNMFTFMKTIPPYWEPMLDMMYEMVGDVEKDSIMLKEVSPVFHVDKIKAPLFIAQGANDPRVNVDESDQMVKAMKERGVDVEYLVKDDEGHGFRNEENRFDFYRSMEKFLSLYLN
ncbi:MAG: S9 family peptidase [Crocinitomicaceae bacterium]|nr:S9 family peptidase [Crocinitomicaceae bacterium]|tara:strand:- start:6357 stop:8279 length:1923 start_codon:yes stop_codon:yes gene_type:complete